MSGYFLAPSLARLRAEINALWPGRDHTSDGWIGDTSHQARKSDHNPDWDAGGVVRAIDVDEDGIDVEAILKAVVHDPRVSYVIYEGRIWGGTRWRPYKGPNPHAHHFHVSIKHTKAAQSGHSWGIRPGSGGLAPVGVIEQITNTTTAPTIKEILGMKLTDRIPVIRGGEKSTITVEQLFSNLDHLSNAEAERYANLNTVPVSRGGKTVNRALRDAVGGLDERAAAISGQLAGVLEALKQVSAGAGAPIDMAAVEAAAERGAENALRDGVNITVEVK